MKKYTVILTATTDSLTDAKILLGSCPIAEDFDCQYGITVTRIEIRDLDNPEDKAVWEISPEMV